MDLTPNMFLNNRYRITSLLGKGGMGAVYLAYDFSLEQNVAVKSNYSPNQDSTQQFLQEARLLASLRHPGLPRVIDYFILEQTQYLVMDFIPGEDLGTILGKEGAQPVEQVLKWVKELGAALNYLHHQKPPVIHRDIKPGNIKLSAEGEAILVDFGIAKAAETSQATATGAMGYTPGYAPPEQYGHARTGPFSDQYSLAATLYALLTNQCPVDSVQRALDQAVLTPMNLLNPAIPVHVQRAIERAMSVRPQDRFPEISEFIQALLDPSFQPTIPTPSHESDFPPIDSHPAPPTRSKKNWIWIAGGIGAVLILLAGLGGTYILFSQRKVQSTPTPPATVLVIENPTEPILIELLQPTPAPLPTGTPAPSATPLPTATSEPNYLANGKLVAFTSNRSDPETFQLYTMKIILEDAGGLVASDIQQLTTSGGSKSQPAWSPDGTRLLYVSKGPDPQNAGEMGDEIWILDLSTEDPQPINISQQNGDDSDPTWSPDGSTIAFVNKNQFTDVLQIYTLKADGTEKRRISGDYFETNPEWTPDMQSMLNIIYASSHHYFHIRDWVEAPYPTPLPTSKPFDRQAFFGRQGEVFDFKLSPSGNQIAYTRVEGYVKQIYVMDFQTRGEKTTLLTSNTTTNYQPAWSPDSQWIVFTSERDGNADIYIMTGTGLLQTNLTNDPATDLKPVWQP